MDAYCTRCKVLLEESDFDPRIGECPRCGRQYTDKEYKAILKRAQGYENKSLETVKRRE